MKTVRRRLAEFFKASALALPVALSALFVASHAEASVSIAISFEALVKDADAVAVVSAGEPLSVWEEGRIYTYTKVHVDQGVAGSLSAGSDAWVRTLGGVVGKIGQRVDGEAVLSAEAPSLLFLRRVKADNVFEVTARAQGQYPVAIDSKAKKRRLIRSSAVGMLLPPKPAQAEVKPGASQVAPQTKSDAAPLASVSAALAQELLHDRDIEDATRVVAAAWKRLHPTSK